MLLLNIPSIFLLGAEEISLLIGLVLTSIFYKKYNDYNEELKYNELIDQLCDD